ncbi:MAG: hypothetical protein KC912_01290 [Proteobacteria bacterium]|nr:hypothetical protein [Pseudomonadota bacterium]
MKRLLLMVCLLPACGPGLLQNSAPRLMSVNGVEVSRLQGIPWGQPALYYTPGELFEIEIEVKDQEGHEVRVWWPESPRGWRFPSDGTEGEWQVPPEEELLAPSSFVIVLEDDHRTNPRTATWFVPIWTEEPIMDTGL